MRLRSDRPAPSASIVLFVVLGIAALVLTACRDKGEDRASPAASAAGSSRVRLSHPPRPIHGRHADGRVLVPPPRDQPDGLRPLRPADERGDRPRRQLPQGRPSHERPAPGPPLQRLRRLQGHGSRRLHPASPPRSRPGPDPRRPHRPHRQGPGAGRLSLHDPDQRSRPPGPGLGARALVEPPGQPRALQRRPHVRGGRGPFPGHRQADLPGDRREERRAPSPHLRDGPGPAPRLPRPPGDRDRPGQALPRDRPARLSRPG